MIRPKLCLVAEGITVDGETNNVSVYNIIEGMLAAGFPIFQSKTAFLCVWERELTDPAQHQAEFSIRLGDQVVFQQEVTIDFLDQLRHRTVIRILGIVLPNPGRMVFRLSLPGHAEAQYEIDLTAGPPAVQVPGQA